MNHMLDISPPDPQSVLRLGFCDYCQHPAIYRTDFGLLCGQHYAYVRIVRKRRYERLP